MLLVEIFSRSLYDRFNIDGAMRDMYKTYSKFKAIMKLIIFLDIINMIG